MVKKSGWKREPQRHSLARKRIKTKNYEYPKHYGAVESVIVIRESDEWNYMWKELAKHPINKDMKNPFKTTEHEEWQYMGTHIDTKKHEFRHRHHPITGKREYIFIPVNEKPVTAILKV